MATLKEVGERALIDRIIKNMRTSSCVGPGDDAACIDINGSKVVVSTDVVTFERHLAKGMTMEQFGWLAAAVNFSDIASMGARPAGILAAVMLPPETDENVLYDIMNGIDQCAEFCDTEVLGGDTKSGHGSVCGTALGICDHNVLMRSGAMPGDLVAMTGSLGSASAGWYASLNDIYDKDTFSAVALPVPRVKEGIFLSANDIATACMDISDGLSTTAAAICGSSGVGMDIMWESLPKGKGVDRICKKLKLSPRELMLNGGGEYELMFTFPRDRLDLLHSSDADISVIGMVTSGKTINIITNGKSEPLENKGYEHFTKD
ncbi:MAG: thiamine-phosphate kinase [Methanomassiliicoccaceae archaeon]|nr:thiamine-phosphate kinase [Methanomassiliicoccaceae archaeon]